MSGKSARLAALYQPEDEGEVPLFCIEDPNIFTCLEAPYGQLEKEGLFDIG
jgi:hypothetical protein